MSKFGDINRFLRLTFFWLYSIVKNILKPTFLTFHKIHFLKLANSTGFTLKNHPEMEEQGGNFKKIK